MIKELLGASSSLYQRLSGPFASPESRSHCAIDLSPYSLAGTVSSLNCGLVRFRLTLLTSSGVIMESA